MDIGNMGHWFAWWSRVDYGKEAIVFEDQRKSYGQVNESINKIAHVLRSSYHIQKGDRVACLLNNCMPYFEIVFACTKIGARFVPVNIRLTGSEILYVVENCSPEIIITENAFIPVLDSVREHVPEGMRVNIEGNAFQESVGAAGIDEPEDQATWEDDFAILYTSGTTGFPKGAVLTQESVKAVCQNAVTAYSHGYFSRALVQAPLCFTGGLIPLSMPMFVSGGTVVLEKTFIPQRTLELIEKEKITWSAAVPTIWKVVSDLPEFAEADLSSLHFAYSGGAPVPKSLLETYQAKGIEFSAGYGLTEGGGFNLYLPLKMSKIKLGGYVPMMWNEVKVVNDRGEEISPDGEVGEICIRGSVILREYWNMPEATAETIRDGWLHTGDLATVDEDGYYYIVDRAKDMIVSGGLNVYPAEIENVIYMHTKVAHAAVIGLPHEKWGEVVTAVIVAKGGETLSGEELMAFCRERLADYKTPKSVIFEKEMPMTSSGKILKRRLRDIYSSMANNTTREVT